MTRKGVKFLVGLTVFGMLGVLLLVYLLNSQTVLTWVVFKAADSLPGETQATAVHGRLWGPIEIEGVTYRSDSQVIEIDRLFLDWHPGSLLNGQIHVSQLTVDGTRISASAQTDEQVTETALLELDLPLPLVLESGQFNDVSISQADADVPMHVKSLQIRGEAEANEIVIESLRVIAVDYQVHISGEITAHGDYPVNLTVHWHTTLTDINRLAGNAHISGDLTALKVTSELTEPGGAKLIGTVDDFLNDLQWQGELMLDNFALAQLADDLPDVTISGRGSTQGTLTEYAVTGQFGAKVPRAGDITTVIDASYKNGLVQIRQAELNQLGSNMSALVVGKLNLSTPQLTFDGNAQWRNFQWPLVGPPLLNSQGGRLQASGSVEAYEFVLQDAAIDYQLIHAEHLSTQGAGSQRHVELRNLQAKVFDGALNGKGSITWAPEFHWQAAVQGSGLNPAALQKNWPGKLAIKLTGSGRGAGKDFSIHAKVSELDGVLRGQTLKGRGEIKKDKQHFSVSDVNFKYGDASVIASGSVAEQIDLTWIIAVPDLSVLHPSLAGEVKSNGRATGPRRRPTIVADMAARDLLWGTLTSVSEINAGLNVDLLGKKHSTLKLSAKDIQYRTLTLTEVSADANGTGSKHVINASLRHPTESLDIGIVGEVTDEVWSGRLQTADLKSETAGYWRLNKPVRFNVAGDTANIEQFCWLDSGARFCGEANWQRQLGWSTAWDINKLPLALLQPFFQPGIKLSGTLNGNAQLTAKERQFTSANLDLSVGPGAMTYMQDNTEVTILAFNTGGVRVLQSEKGIDANMQVEFSEGGKLDGALHLPGTDLLNTDFEDNTVGGRLDINTRQLSLARLFYPELGELSGELVSNLTLDGTLQEPRFAGQASVRQASVAIPQLGLNLQDINLNAQGANDEQLRLSGSAKSGEGSLTMEGELEFDPRQGSPGTLRLKGSQFQVVNLPDAKAVVSPDLEIKRKGRRIDVNGQVEIPRASVRAVSLPSNVPVSRDVVFVDDLETEEERRARATRLLVYSNVKVIVGDDVEFNGYGLRGKLAGDIEVVDEPGRASMGQGALHITEGRFSAFGVSLNIDLGRVIFTGGPVDDPGIDARATRRTGDVTAGVRVSGRLKSPEISVFSIPSMPESEAMSYLLFGRMVRETSFGADQLTQPGAGTDTGIGFGTFLSPRVYVNYVTSVLNPTSVLRVRFQLTDRWELHTESASTHRAADAVFTFER